MITTRRLLSNVGATMLLKAASILIGFLTIPAYIRYFDDTTQLGLWFTLLSVLNWMLFFDFGLGNGIKNKVTFLVAENDLAGARSVVAGGYTLLIVGAGMLLVIAGVLLWWLSHGELLSGFLAPKTHNEWVFAVAVVGVVFALQFPLRLSTSLLYGLQRSALATAIPLATNALVLGYLITLGPAMSGNLRSLVGAYALAIVLPLLFGAALVGRQVRRWPRPAFRVREAAVQWGVIHAGAGFFFIQLCLMGINGTNEFLILSLHDADDVVDYQVYFRVFSVFMVAMATLTLPLWSAIAQANALGERGRILQIAQLLQLSIGVAAICLVVACLLFDSLLGVWLPDGSVVADTRALIYFAVYIFVMLVIMAASCVANGFGELRPQIYSLTVAVLLKVLFLTVYSSFDPDWYDLLLVNTLVLVPAAITIVYGSMKLVYSRRASAAT